MSNDNTFMRQFLKRFQFKPYEFEKVTPKPEYESMSQMTVFCLGICLGVCFTLSLLFLGSEIAKIEHKQVIGEPY